MSLTKDAIVRRLQNELGLTKAKSIEIAEIFLELIKSTLASGEDVLISGFGKFCVKEKAERLGRNPAMKSEMILPARRVIRFSCSNKLCKRINGK